MIKHMPRDVEALPPATTYLNYVAQQAKLQADIGLLQAFRTPGIKKVR